MTRINSHVGGVHIKLDTKRIDGNLKEAQKKLIPTGRVEK